MYAIMDMIVIIYKHERCDWMTYYVFNVHEDQQNKQQ